MGTAPTPIRPPVRRTPVHQEIATVTPALATTWLEGNTHNRSIRDDHVAALARDMRGGRWHMTGDSVKFDENGVLIDGQHRLWAVVESGVTVPLLVVYGLEPEAQDYIDIGRRRTTADALNLRDRGEYAASMASIARGVLLVQRPGQVPTQAEVLELAARDEALLVAGGRLMRQARTCGLRGGAIYGIGFYFLSYVDADAAGRFFGALVSGESLAAGSPILALRRRFLQTPPRLGSHASGTRVNLAYIVKAWNAWRDGRSVQALRYAMDEPMPVAH